MLLIFSLNIIQSQSTNNIINLAAGNSILMSRDFDFFLIFFYFSFSIISIIPENYQSFQYNFIGINLFSLEYIHSMIIF
jgi:hypothetical protein